MGWVPPEYFGLTFGPDGNYHLAPGMSFSVILKSFDQLAEPVASIDNGLKAAVFNQFFDEMQIPVRFTFNKNRLL